MASLPDYITKAVANPKTNRAPWYVNTAPSYAGIFLWVAFYQAIAVGTLNRGSLAVCMAGIVVAGVLSYLLYYYVPGMLGMKTGFPLYVVGSSTFGTTGGWLMPGLLMGLLQVGWFAVGTFFAAKYILSAFGSNSNPGTIPFAVVSIVWGYTMAYVGVKGIQYVSKVSLLLNAIPFIVILVVFLNTMGGISHHLVAPAEANSWVAFSLMIQIIIGFFATAGAAGADFGMSSRNETDVRLGGLVGIAIAIVYTAGLPLLSVAGARGLYPNLVAQGAFTYDTVIGAIGGFLAMAMFALFAIASIAPACICAFVAGNSFSTMLPSIPRMVSTMIGVTISIVLAITGVAANLIGFFSIVGASFGPICGAMAADYLLSGRKWAGPREGINIAGCGAWVIGFLVGILPFLPISAAAKVYVQPAVVYGFVVGFVVYILLAKFGLEAKVVAAAPRGAE